MEFYSYKMRAWIVLFVAIGYACLYVFSANAIAFTAWPLLAAIGFGAVAADSVRRFPQKASLLVLELTGVLAFTVCFLARLFQSKLALAAGLSLLSIHLLHWSWMFGRALR